jgi:hypothetical protein
MTKPSSPAAPPTVDLAPRPMPKKPPLQIVDAGIAAGIAAFFGAVIALVVMALLF